jgi:acyl carrier protein
VQPTHLTMEDLMDILVSKAGLPRAATTIDPDATFADIDLDSLAYLQLGGEVVARFGFELDDARPHETFGEILALINEGLAVHQAVAP